MRIIFLDVDGVLNSAAFAQRVFENEGIRIFNEDMLDKCAITYLKQIVEATGAEIVLSSSWRKIPRLKKKLSRQLSEYGLSIYSDTPYVGKERGDDISQWFADHDDVVVESYVILDDDADMNIHLPHLVKTSFEYGLEKKHVQCVIDKLTNNQKGKSV